MSGRNRNVRILAVIMSAWIAYACFLKPFLQWAGLPERRRDQPARRRASACAGPLSERRPMVAATGKRPGSLAALRNPRHEHGQTVIRCV